VSAAALLAMIALAACAGCASWTKPVDRSDAMDATTDARRDVRRPTVARGMVIP
jgi:hypothetical protein